MGKIQNYLVEIVTGCPSKKVAKTNLIRLKHGRQGGWPVSIMYMSINMTARGRGLSLSQKLRRSSPLKTIVRIQYNLVEIVAGWPSTKIAKTNLIRQKTWPPGGLASFHYVLKHLLV